MANTQKVSTKRLPTKTVIHSGKTQKVNTARVHTGHTVQVNLSKKSKNPFKFNFHFEKALAYTVLAAWFVYSIVITGVVFSHGEDFGSTFSNGKELNHGGITALVFFCIFLGLSIWNGFNFKKVMLLGKINGNLACIIIPVSLLIISLYSLVCGLTNEAPMIFAILMFSIITLFVLFELSIKFGWIKIKKNQVKEATI